jgi:hypothetical protein
MDDLFSGAIEISWRKLHVFVEEDRRATERDTVWEWFQWLAERMLEREKKVPPFRRISRTDHGVDRAAGACSQTR